MTTDKSTDNKPKPLVVRSAKWVVTIDGTTVSVKKNPTFKSPKSYEKTYSQHGINVIRGRLSSRLSQNEDGVDEKYLDQLAAKIIFEEQSPDKDEAPT